MGRRAGIEPVSYSSPDPNHWATPHPTKLSRSLLSYAAPYCATPLPAELRRTLLSYAAPCWAMPHPAELRRSLLIYAAPFWATPHPTELRSTLLTYAAPYWKPPPTLTQEIEENCKTVQAVVERLPGGLHAIADGGEAG